MDTFINDIAAIKASANLQALDDFIKKHVKQFFNTPYIYKVYELIKDHTSQDDCVNLLMAWLALLSGDNLKLSVLSKKITSDNLSQDQVSFYYDLMALSALSGALDERISYSDKSLKNLSDQVSFYHANAHLTRGQLMNGLQEYRQAYQHFYQAYDMFFKEDMMFAGAVSLTNALLAKNKMAHFKDVIEEGKKVLMMSSTIEGESFNAWDIVRLALGIAYLETGYLSESIAHLKQALKTIQSINLVHMHGLIEMSLMKAYALNQDKHHLTTLIKDMKALFNKMHYPIMKAFYLYGTLLKEDSLSKEDIESLSLIYQETKHSQLFIVEMLVYLGHKQNEVYISRDDLIKHIETCRYHGDVVGLVPLLVLLADDYLSKKEKNQAKVIAQEAIDLIKQHNLKTVLDLYDYESIPLIKTIDPLLIKDKPMKKESFTGKELEILLLLKEGLTNKDIGEKLFISVGTVKWHINHILGKLNAKNRIQAVNRANSLGIYKNLT